METVSPHRLPVLLITLLLLAATSAFAQWQKVNSFNVGIGGKLLVHGSAIFEYGNQGGYKLYRSINNGDSWQDITASAPATFADIFSFNGKLYATWLSTVYISENLGDSWTPLSGVTVTGSGVLLGFASDGSTLFAFSNRKSVFKSTNNGASWTEYIIDNPNNFLVVDFCAVGNRYSAAVAGAPGFVGSWVSENGGQNWQLRNPAVGASNVFAHNGTVLGMSFGGGMFRLENSSSTWEASNTGIPDNGYLVVPKTIVARDNTLYMGFFQIVTNLARIAKSVDNGLTWTLVDSVGHPPSNPASSTRHIAVTPTHLFSYFASTNPGVYRTPLAPSSVQEIGGPAVAQQFSLQQNYPNPFNPTTVIRFSVPSGVDNADVRVRVYDILGKEIAELVNEKLRSGNYETTFNGKGFSSGVYFYRLNAGNISFTKRMIMAK